MEASAAEAQMASGTRARTTPTPVVHLARSAATSASGREKSGRLDGRTQENGDHRQADERGHESREDLTPITHLDRIEIAPPRAGEELGRWLRHGEAPGAGW